MLWAEHCEAVVNGASIDSESVPTAAGSAGGGCAVVVPADHTCCGLLPPPRHRPAGHQGGPPLLSAHLLGFTSTAL